LFFFLVQECKKEIYCFCRLPAAKSYSDVFGWQFDCYYTFSESQDICGFHIHEQDWYELLAEYEESKRCRNDETELRKILLEHPGLSCPWFNFTACTIFNVYNGRKIKTPNGPECFCSSKPKPVAVTSILVNLRRRGRTPRAITLGNYQDLMFGELCFTCPDYHIPDRQPKCTYFLPAKDERFIRTSTIHESSQMTRESTPSRCWRDESRLNERELRQAAQMKVLELEDKLEEQKVTIKQSHKVNHVAKCTICLGCYIDPVVITSCGHVFCQQCYQTWFDTKKQEYPNEKPRCPTCRVPMKKAIPFFCF
jgi:hypothetical protein